MTFRFVSLFFIDLSQITIISLKCHLALFGTLSPNQQAPRQYIYIGSWNNLGILSCNIIFETCLQQNLNKKFNIKTAVKPIYKILNATKFGNS